MGRMREIKPINHNGSIQLKFSFGGKRYSFNPIPGGSYTNKRDFTTVSAIASRIQNDILAGCFDPTLVKYRLDPKPTEAITKPQNLLELWDAWVETLDLPAPTKANHYEAVRQMLVKANPAITETSWLVKAKLAPSTFNKRLGYVKSCFRWAFKKQIVDANPFEDIKNRKVISQKVKPFTTKEIQTIILGFEAEAPRYTPFVRFLFLTGARLSEAIGLRWCHVDFERNELTIKESLSRDRVGNKYHRIRKETKNNTVRCLAMTSELRGLLLGLKPTNVDMDDLVFTTHEGCVISPENFRSRYWLVVLEKYQVPYRKPHSIRHTTLSIAIEQGTPITGVAYLAGHVNTTMVIQTYGHMVNRPKLPDIPI